MKARVTVGLVGVALLLLAAGCGSGNPGVGAKDPAPPEKAKAIWPATIATATVPCGRYTLSGPYTHDNLTVFLVCGADKVKGKTYLTLPEALEQKKVVVRETGQVNELTIENLSDEEVFIQSGDIVKGGQQDRAIATDFIVLGKSGPQPLASFCVEHGRWSGRGDENSAAFDTARDRLISRDLRLAAADDMDQSKVWAKVAESQEKLSKSVKSSVQSPVSASSLQLTIENPQVEKTVAAYARDLAKVVEDQGDALGFACTINGKVNSINIYVSHTFFKKLWPRMLKASAAEALAERIEGAQSAPGQAEDVRTCILDSEKGAKRTERRVSADVKITTLRTERTLRMTTSRIGVATGLYQSGSDNIFIVPTL